jgi:hypothetical protein
MQNLEPLSNKSPSDGETWQQLLPDQMRNHHRLDKFVHKTHFTAYFRLSVADRRENGVTGYGRDVQGRSQQEDHVQASSRGNQHARPLSAAGPRQ